MDEAVKSATLKDFRRIPGVGKSIAVDLWNLGLREVAELKNRDPEELYTRLCIQQGTHVDRCMLYVLRCAVYYASTADPEPALLQWWIWKDR